MYTFFILIEKKEKSKLVVIKIRREGGAKIKTRSKTEQSKARYIVSQ